MISMTAKAPANLCRISRADAWMPKTYRGERLAFAIVDYGGDQPIVRLFHGDRGRDFYVRKLRRLNNGWLVAIGWATFK